VRKTHDRSGEEFREWGLPWWRSGLKSANFACILVHFVRISRLFVLENWL
jgi:hypothetical protein